MGVVSCNSRWPNTISSYSTDTRENMTFTSRQQVGFSHPKDCVEKSCEKKWSKRRTNLKKIKRYGTYFQIKNEWPMFWNLRLFSFTITPYPSTKHADNSIFFIKTSRKISLDSDCEELYLTSFMGICLYKSILNNFLFVIMCQGNETKQF